MILEELRDRVCAANIDLVSRGLVLGTFGNVSGVDREEGVFVIKASGVPYSELNVEHMVPISIATGEPLEDLFRPSSDTPTHLELYRAFRDCGGIAHTHSECATTLAQSSLPIACMGTTHADHFRGDVPVTRSMTVLEVESDYERNTGLVIVEAFEKAGLSASDIPAVLVANHGPFAWGGDAAAAVDRAEVLEFIARMECMRLAMAPNAARPASFLIDKHFLRKHGARAYYGQPKDE